MFTFQENPLQVLTGNTVPTLLASNTRNRIFEEIGVEQVFIPSFPRSYEFGSGKIYPYCTKAIL